MLRRTAVSILLVSTFGCAFTSAAGETETDTDMDGANASSTSTGGGETTVTSTTVGNDGEGGGADTNLETTTGQESTSEGDASSDEGSTGSGAACPPGGLPPGRYDGVTLEVGGRTRSYDLFIPETVDVTTPTPLVLNLHGLLGSPAQQASFSEYDAAAVSAGVVVAYPAGVASSWNGGACCGEAQSQGVDDVEFARTLVANISLTNCIDDRRVYAIGMSNGGHMAHRLACEAADVFAATASITGVLTLPPESCAPSRSISVLQFHGTDDNIVPYGGAGPGYPNVRTMMQGWRDRNGCAPVPDVFVDEGDALCERWPACEGGVDVSLCTIDGGGHCWPGNPDCIFGDSTTAVSANAVIQTMMARQVLPGG